jgi:hypothetical protein
MGLSWQQVNLGDRRAARGAWQHNALPAYASEFGGRVAFAWRGVIPHGIDRGLDIEMLERGSGSAHP